MKVRHTADEPLRFDHYDPEALANILEMQHKITTFSQKKERRQNAFTNSAHHRPDDPSFTRQSNLLHVLYTRVRLNVISTTAAMHKFNAIHPIIKISATNLYVYRLRNTKDLEEFVAPFTTKRPQ